MQIHILSVGEIKTPYLRDGVSDYLGRLRHYCRIRTDSVPGEKMDRNRPGRDVLDKEAEKLIRRIPDGGFVVALDRLGKACSSEELAGRLSEWQNRGTEHAVFAVGGPLGLSPKIIERADAVISLSKMTFAHEIVQLILLEQLYRAFTILKGEKYHK
jgi:23S rRNA (pseudouridine1915-N3)-methyltransferase